MLYRLYRVCQKLIREKVLTPFKDERGTIEFKSLVVSVLFFVVICRLVKSTRNMFEYKMNPILSVKNLNKIYADQFQALKNINLDVYKGEIFALLGPNGAGKTTLINAICGIINYTDGKILINGNDINEQFRLTRTFTGLVPQELSIETFEPVINTVNFSRGLFGLPPNKKHVENILKKLTLWDKRHKKIMTLSGGMKKRVMIAKALAHEPQLLFLDEPTAGVDVELRKDMWNQVKELKDMGVTIILTTHYIEEAEKMADRIGVISNGEIIVTESKDKLMKKFGSKQLTLDLNVALNKIPEQLSRWNLNLSHDGTQISYIYNLSEKDNCISRILAEVAVAGISYKDIYTKQSSLEEIFIELVNQ